MPCQANETIDTNKAAPGASYILVGNASGRLWSYKGSEFLKENV